MALSHRHLAGHLLRVKPAVPLGKGMTLMEHVPGQLSMATIWEHEPPPDLTEREREDWYEAQDVALTTSDAKDSGEGSH